MSNTNEGRAWSKSLDATLGNPLDVCSCGHTRDHHGMTLGVNGRGRCNQCENKFKICAEFSLALYADNKNAVPLTAAKPAPQTGTETPRTDKAAYKADIPSGFMRVDHIEIVEADFARTLEKELNAAKAERDALRSSLTAALAALEGARKDTARLDWLEKNHGVTLNQHGEANIVRFEYKFMGELRPAIDAALSATPTTEGGKTK